MAVTLNGIAQGYIADRVAELLRDGGIDNVPVDLGEARAVRRHPEGRPRAIGLAGPRAPARYGPAVELANRALATPGGATAPASAPTVGITACSRPPAGAAQTIVSR